MERNVSNRFYLTATTIGDNVLVREWNDGEVRNCKLKWSPTIYVKCPESEATHKSLYKDPVKSIMLGSISKTKDYVKQYSEVPNFEVFGQLNYTLQFLNEYPQGIPDLIRVPTRGIDIETRVPESGFPVPARAEAEIKLITCMDRGTRKPITFGCRKYEGKDTEYIQCTDEKDLLIRFIDWWSKSYPVVVTGWNSDEFDMGYLCNRILQILGEKFLNKLSPWGRVTIKEAKHDPDILDVDIVGIELLDYLKLMKKYTYGERASWKLGSVAEEELGTTKLDHSEYKTFNEFMDKDWQKFVQYNVIDVELVFKLDDKMKMLDLAMGMAYKAKINFSDVWSPVKTWDAIICNRLLDEGVVAPQRKSTGKSAESIMGGYVKTPKPGLVGFGSSIDATSLYPSIMRLLNLSPETYRGMRDSSIEKILAGAVFDDLKEKNWSMGANGAQFDKSEHGIIPRIITEYMADRRKAKKEMLALEGEYEKTHDKSLLPRIASLDNLQMGLKILSNALYGGLLNAGCRFFDPDVAEAITSTGQLYIRNIEDNISEIISGITKIPGLNIHIYSDTDSLYFDLDKIIKKYCGDASVESKIKNVERFTKEIITPEVDKLCNKLNDILNIYEPSISFKLEKAYDRGVFVAKKKYAVRAYSSEGVTYDKPEIKVTGLEMIRSSTPELVKERLANVFNLIFDKDEPTIQEYVEEVRKEFLTCDLNMISRPTGINSLDSSIDPKFGIPKGVSINARAAMIHNNEVKKHGLETRYRILKPGDKIKMIYLKMPNPVKENVIGWSADETLPPEFGLEKYVDRELQFDKTFMSATKIILNAIGWSPVKIDTLDEFFG